MQPNTRDDGSLSPVATLLGHAHVEMALLCLGSLLRFSAAPLRLRIHDDGSLTEADLERLDVLGHPEIVSRREADDRLAEALAARPATRAFRAATPLALKLLDVPLLAAGDDLAYCDSDVLFLRPFSVLFRLPPGCGALFMCDPQNAYSVRSWHMLTEPRLRLAARVNTGIIGFRTRWFDPDLVEWFLARPRYRFAPVWVEHTCWALLAAPPRPLRGRPWRARCSDPAYRAPELCRAALDPSRPRRFRGPPAVTPARPAATEPGHERP